MPLCPTVTSAGGHLERYIDRARTTSHPPLAVRKAMEAFQIIFMSSHIGHTTCGNLDEISRASSALKVNSSFATIGRIIHCTSRREAILLPINSYQM